MTTTDPKEITVEVVVNAPLEKAWRYFTEPEHITKWNNASPDWHSPKAENDLRVGGTFNYRMEAKDGNAGFDFAGTYTGVVPHRMISYTMGDRKVKVTFEEEGSRTHIVEVFEPETVNSWEMQRSGWQAILDNFKSHCESIID
jgi:uncharacterized protein YndB with AHSA1/START domain